jgi:hypothetical protein
MHDLLIALAFIAMVVVPALVAAKSGLEVTDDRDYDLPQRESTVVGAHSSVADELSRS